MKTAFYFLLLVCASAMSCSNAANQPTTTLTPQIISTNSGTTVNLRGIFFDNATNGYIVGDSGTILSTTDGGTTWSKVQTTLTNLLTSCFSHNGIKYVGGDQMIAYGDSITNLSHTQNVNGAVYSFTALNDGKIIAVGGYNVFNTSVGKVFTRSPSENTWSSLADSLISLGQILDVITLSSSNTLWCIPRCKNLGACPSGIRKFNFSNLKEDTLTENTAIVGIQSLSRIGSTIIGVGLKIARSTDSGVTWSQQTTPNGEILLSIAMLSTTIGYACGVDGALLATYDGGQSWSALQSGTTKNLFRIFFPTSTVGYAVGDEGTIIKIDLAGN